MIIGQKILDMGLVVGGTRDNLKHSTFDLTVGHIIPIGKGAVKARKKEPPRTYYLEPREMLWILSKEEFKMPPNVTGLATLRTTFTKKGILALNVGIIDPFFEGPISTALINFSDRPRRIDVGEKFFRVIFLEHADVTAHHEQSENTDHDNYLKALEVVSYADFSRSFLNIPSFDDDFYYKKFWSIIYYGFVKRPLIFYTVSVLIIIQFWFLIHLGFFGFLQDKWNAINEFRKSILGG
ncbi:MAG: dCTP deaminase domain-containing protein [Methylocella sp.]